MPNLKNLFEKNARIFSERHHVWGKSNLDEIWQALSGEDIEALETGISQGRWLFKGKLLHSERDPRREAARAADGFQNARAVIAVSLGAGFFLAELKVRTQEVLIIEPSLLTAAAFILSGEFLKYGGKISLFCDPLIRADALEEILPWLQGKNLKETLIYCHAAFMAIDPKAATRAVERIRALFEKRSVNQATIVKFQQLWNKNIILNQRIIAKGGAMRQILDAPPPEAIVLAGAGPSLAHSLTSLKTHRSQFVLFAADTAFIPLIKAGIQPDFVFAADPQWLNHYFAQHSSAGKSRWVMDPVVSPAIPRFVTGKGGQTFFWNNVFLADTYFRQADRGDVAHGGSVSTNAFDMAERWFASRPSGKPPGRLILVGQDLSFSNRQAHAPGAVLEAQVFARAQRLYGMEQHNFRQMTAMPVLWQKGIRQGRVRTNGKLKIFLEWFEARAAECDKSIVRFINATYDGAFLRGFEHLSLEESLKDVGNAEAANILNGVEIPDIQAKVKKLAVEINSIENLMRDSEERAREKNPSAASIACMNANDEKLRSLMPAKDIVALNAQAMILKMTEQGESTEAHEFYSAMARSARELGHWLGKIKEP